MLANCAASCGSGGKRYGKFNSWGSWSTCTKSCAGGTQQRSRKCVQKAGEYACQGKSSESRSCNTKSCPVKYGKFTSWGEWSTCTKSCDGGTQKRSRTCEKKAGEKPCQGEKTMMRSCNANSCPVIQKVPQLYVHSTGDASKSQAIRMGVYKPTDDVHFGKAVCKKVGATQYLYYNKNN